MKAKSQTPVVNKQITLDEMIQDVKSRTLSGKLKKQETIKIRCTKHFKRFLDIECQDADMSHSDLLAKALECYITTWSSRYYAHAGMTNKRYTDEDHAIIQKGFQ